MNIHMWITIGILITAIVLFITEWLRVDVVAFCVVVSLILFNVLTVDEALAGFSNPIVLTIAALFIVGGATLRTGVAANIGRRILRIGGKNPLRLTFVMMFAVAILSSFLSDTGTVALLLPAVLVLAHEAKLPPSKLLIPLSYGALLGGAMTLIGTTPNLIVSELLAENGLPPFGFFSFSPIGLLLLFFGILFMLTVGRKLLPERHSKIEGQPVENPVELIDLYRLPGNLFHLRVRRTSGLRGKPLHESGFREDYGVNVLDVLRRVEPRRPQPFVWRLDANAAPVVVRESRHPEADMEIELDDILIVQGEPNQVTKASSRWNLGVRQANGDEDGQLITKEIGIAEVLLPPRSRLAGKNIIDLRFGTLYHLNVLGIARPGEDEKLDPKNTSLQFGDILLVQGAWENILALRKTPRDFVVLGQPESYMGAPRSKKAGMALLIMAGMLGLMITNLVSVATASLLAALLMVLCGCLSMDDAYQSIDWKSIILIAGMLPMSTALTKTGAIELAAESFTTALGSLGPVAVLGALFVVTSMFTQVLSNTATAVLIGPIALATAQTLGLRPQAFLMAVAIAASMAFASPVASPVNTLVMGAGNYRFKDYLKVGMPMILLMLVISVIALPMLFPFH
ncbi:SLC13 family permease [bacterium]|nr:SLC13 family permease [bacterium]